jgi:histone deacetylase 6
MENNNKDVEELEKEFEKLLQLKEDKIGFVFDERMLLHKNFEDSHVERPERAMSIYMNLIFKGLKDKLIRLPSQEIEEERLRRIHTKEYIDTVYDLKYEPLPNDNTNSIKKERLKVENKFQLCFDTYDNYYTNDAARISAGSLLSCCKAVANNKVNQAFAIIRPPGHHSNNGKCRGFCFFNNVAIAADYLKVEHKLKVAIVDWDVHHGDGTQDIFYKDNNPLFISLHRFDKGSFYPCTGKFTEIGEGIGEGFNINIPWNTQHIINSQSSIGDDEYYYAFETIVLPVLKDYKPDVILVSCGFDAAENDPLGRMSLTPLGYSYMTYSLLKVCNKLIFALEGGYNIDSLSRCSEGIIRTLLRDYNGFNKVLLNSEIKNLNLNLNNLNKSFFSPSNYAIEQINTTKNYLEKYWNCLKSVQIKTPKRNIVRKDDQSIINDILNINESFKKYLFLENEDDKIKELISGQYLIIKLGYKTVESTMNLNSDKYNKKVNIDSRTSTPTLGFRIKGMKQIKSNANTKESIDNLNWIGKDLIFDLQNDEISFLLIKFFTLIKINKNEILSALEAFSNDYETHFTERNLDLYDVNLFIFPKNPNLNLYESNIVTRSKAKALKKNSPPMEFVLKLNAFKSYSLVKKSSDDNHNYLSGIRKFREFITDTILV